MRRLTLLIAAILAALALTACGDDESNNGMDTGATDHNAADITFAQNMISHHRQAIEMAGLAETRARSPEVKTLAGQIRAAQAPEIATMVGWLTTWKHPTAPPADGGSGPDMSGHGTDMPMRDGTMNGMMSGDDMAGLTSATGPAFDTMFLTMMIQHHQGAVDMAKSEIRDGQYGPAKHLAETIQSTQTTEITTMRTLLTKV